MKREIPVVSAADEIAAKVDKSLIFISHDTRDAELAEEFSKLLKSASSGALKSFRSSDKKGTQGIEYGEEWYPTIMDKIDEASDVVCLLTRNSIDRPWILYEAGVAKGKLDKKVIGIALGIPFKEAVTGPFAQFQNNDGDANSITGLILSLVNKIGLDPDQDLVKMLVEKFIIRVAEITSNLKKQNSDSDEEANSVTKLFEEVKVMFDALPSRIENRIEPGYRRRKRKLHPMMFEEALHVGEEHKDPLFGFLLLISLFRDDYPWLYEVGIETYRGLKSMKPVSHKKKLISNFE
ncbi:MAG TPA: toll/interleukin-1 receptor domain-containing protein, partial [Candidatus Babeliaceae bacterium]|nr:toll/interleukin-1 receptor domain-containing protein [Candidatus Babeliaceae bacterium]